ncbi:MAG: PQQ-binding-like beta-propeller repeat protein [Rhodopirellula sp.]|nr:PQQ-binding-like beta-propeller repeat protein [Rhodopirellula sp.]
MPIDATDSEARTRFARLFQPALLTVVCLLTAPARAGDWPQFRYDTGRTAASPHELPASLQLRWSRTLPTPRPAFPRELRLAYDASYEPVVLGHTMFVPSMVTDSVTAIDTETGNSLWRFFAEGPVRFAPVAWEGKVFFVSDDGYLYCVSVGDGSLRWKFRGLPEGKPDRKVIGHGRLVSLWPARGGPVLADGVVYFAAGLWPTEGVFVHAVDAESGRAVWSNTDSDRIPKSNWDHGQGQEAGLTPQGYLAIVGDRLIVPCGAQLPAFLDLKTGKLQTYTTGWGGRLGLPKGCWFVAGVGKYLSHAGDLYDITRPSQERLPKLKPGQTDYKPMLYPGGWTRLDIERANQRELDRFRQPVLTPETAYESDQAVVARDLTSYTLHEWTADNMPPHRAKDEVPETFGADFRRLWELPSKLDVHIKAGTRLYAGGPGVVEAIDIAGRQPKVVWHTEIEGTPHRILAADGRLFVVTDEGSILAFASGQPGEVTAHTVSGSRPTAADNWTELAKAILAATAVRDGYALVLGIDRGRLVEELVGQSNLHVIAVDADPSKVAAVRDRLDALGYYGTRASVLVGNPVTYPFSPYLASLVVSETPDVWVQADGQALACAVFHTLRPYGGVACAWGSLADRSRIDQIAKDEAFYGASVRQSGDFVLLARSGALPGAADWSHAEADAASTGASQDEFIRSPMTVLWFDAAERWHKYPGQNQVRVVGGRLVLFEEGLLRASDVYTGRKLWEINVPLGKEPLTDPLARQAVRYAKQRQWGPKASLAETTQLVVVEDAIYLSEGTSCLVFDPATGETAGHIDLPDGLQTPWANLRVYGDYLVGSSGRHVLCVDRRTGKLLWQVEAARGELSLAVGGDKVFCAELTNPKRGEDETRDGSMFACHIATGERVWQRTGGAPLRYSPALDIVVTPSGFYRGSDGEPLPPKFEKSDSPRRRLVVQGRGLPEPGLPGYIAGSKLLTGNEETLQVVDMPSGELIGEPLKWVRRGCTGTRASAHLLTTRYHGNSAWIDLDSREITPLLGVRPGCSVNNNLYPANGVLNIPNLTAGCTCNYAPVSMACVPAICRKGLAPAASSASRR